MVRLEPVHPGEILKHDFMEPLGLSATALAKAIDVTPARINEIVRGRRGITAGTALRLARYFETDAQSWMNLQTGYELVVAERDTAAAVHCDLLRLIVPAVDRTSVSDRPGAAVRFDGGLDSVALAVALFGKELLDGLQIDRTSCCRFWVNQLRVFLTAAAYVLMQEVRVRAARTACARTQATWLRDRLLKLGVHVVRSVRRVVLHLPRVTPHLEAWRHIALALGARAG